MVMTVTEMQTVLTMTGLLHASAKMGILEVDNYVQTLMNVGPLHLWTAMVVTLLMNNVPTFFLLQIQPS
jgi:hypothetical protein